MVHVNIFKQIFKAGLARARHTPAESFLDTSIKTFLVPSSMETLLEMDTH